MIQAERVNWLFTSNSKNLLKSTQEEKKKKKKSGNLYSGSKLFENGLTEKIGRWILC